MATAPDDTNWLGGNGDWSNPVLWSNGVPQATSVTATIAPGSISTISIAVGESFGVGAVTLDGYGSTLDVLGTLATNGFAIDAGTVINAGSIAGPISVTYSATLVEQAGTLQTLPNTANLTLAGGALAFDSSGTGTVTVVNAAGAVFTGFGTVEDAFTINSVTGSSPVNPVLLDNQGTLAVTPGFVNTVSGSISYFSDALSIDTDSLINAGLITAALGEIDVSGLSLTNQGVISGNSAAINLYSGIDNTGTISLTDGTLTLGSVTGAGIIEAQNANVILDGPENIAAIRALTLTNDNITIDGRFDNTSQTLNAASAPLLGASLGSLGTITGGALDQAALAMVFDGGTLNNVALIDGFTLDTGAVTLAGTTADYSDAGSSPGTVTINGGTLALEAPASGTITQPVMVQSGTLILDPASPGLSFAINTPISVSGSASALIIDPYYSNSASNWTNQNSLTVANGATLELGGDATMADLGAISLAAATVDLIGIFDNTNQTLNATSGPLVGAALDGGTISGGALDAGALGMRFLGGALDNVTLINGFTLTGNTTFAGSTAVDANAGATPGTATIDGGTLVITSPADGTITQAVIVTAGDLTLQAVDTPVLDIAAPISATGSASTIALQPLQYGTIVAALSDSSAISIASGASLLLGGVFTEADLGSLTNSGGTVVITGTLDNVGQTLNAASTALLGLELEGGTISGGAIDVSALQLQQSFFTGTLDNVTLLNGLSLASGTLDLLGTDPVLGSAGTTGSVTLGSNAGLVLVGDSLVTLANPVDLAGGVLDFQGVTFGGPVSATIAAGDLVSGYGEIGNLSGAETITNDGTITATGTNSPYLRLYPEELVNNGLISAASGAVLEFGYAYNTSPSSLTNNDTITGNSANVQLAADFTNAGLINITGGELTLGDSLGDPWSNTGTILATSAAVTLAGFTSLANLTNLTLNQSTLDITGTLDAAGATLGTSTSPGPSALTGATLNGGTILGGVIDFASLGIDLLNGNFDAVSFINGLTLTTQNVTIEGASTIFADAGVTQGTIVIDGTQSPTPSLELLATSGETITQAIDDIAGRASIIGAFTLNSALTAAGPGATLQLDGSLVGSNGVTSAVAWVNLATIVADSGAVVLLGGDLTAADIGTIANSGASLYFENGTFDNIGQTLGAADPALIGLQLAGGTIDGGVIAASSSFAVSSPGYYSSPALDNVTLLGGLNVNSAAVTLLGSTAIWSDGAETAAGSLSIGIRGTVDFADADNYTLDNPVTLAGGSLVWSPPPATNANTGTITVGVTLAAGDMVSGTGLLGGYQRFDQATDLTNFGTLLGGGAINYRNGLTISATQFDNQGLISAATNGAVQIGYGAETIRNDGTITAGPSSSVTLGGTFTNAGLITANGGTLMIGNSIGNSFVGNYDYTLYSAVTNLGTIAATGGMIELNGNLSLASLGSFDRGGAGIALTGGVFNNSASTLGALSTDLLGLVLDGGTIAGGALDPAGLGLSIGPGTLSLPVRGDSVLDNVSILGNLTLGAGVKFEGSTHLGTLAGTNTLASLVVESTGIASFTGAGNFTLNNNVSLAGGRLAWHGPNYSENVTISNTSTVIGYGSAGDYGVGTLNLVNQGTILAHNTNGRSLNIDITSLVNQGLIAAENGGGVNLYGGVTTLAGGTFAAYGNSGFYGSQLNAYRVNELAAALILSGSLASSDIGNALTSIAAGASLALNAGANFQDNNPLIVDGSISLANGTLTAANLTLNADANLTGNGAVTGTSLDLAGGLTATGGTLALATSLSGTGSLAVASGAALVLSNADANNVNLLASGATLQLDDPQSVTGTIVNFGGSDAIILNGVALAATNFANGTLTVSNANTTITLALDGSFAADAFGANIATPGETIITLAPGNNPLSLAAPARVFDNPGTVVTINGLSIADSLDPTITVSVTDQFGVLAATAQAGDVVQGNGSNDLIIIGSASVVDQSLAGLDYRAPSVGIPQDTITILATAAGGAANAQIIADINQPPSFALPAAVLLQPGTAGALTGVTLAKSGALAGETFTVTVNDATTTLTGTASGAGALIGSGGTLVTLIGTLADIEAELASLSLTGTANDILTLSAADGLGGSVIAELPIDVNLPGAIDAPAAFIAPDGSIVGIPGLNLSDPYAAASGETVTLTLQDQSGALATGYAGVTATGNSSNGLTLTGTVQQINLALAGLSYSNPPAAAPLDPITLTLTDAFDAVTQATITAASVIEPPVIAAANFTGADGVPVGNLGIALSDAYAAALGQTLTVILADQTGTLSASGTGISGNGSATLTLTGSLAAINQDLASLDYTGAGFGWTTDPIEITASAPGATLTSRTIVASAPAVTISAPQDIVSLFGTTAAVPGITISDPAAANANALVLATLTASAGDLFAPTGSLANGATLTGSGTSTLVISGSLAAVNAELAALQYEETAGPGNITITTQDALGNQAQHFITTNDALFSALPQISTAITTATPTEAVAAAQNFLSTIVMPSALSQLLNPQTLQLLSTGIPQARPGTSFSPSQFTAAINQGQSIFALTEAGQIPTAQQITDFLTAIFASTGINASSQIPTLATDFLTIFTDLAANSGNPGAINALKSAKTNAIYASGGGFAAAQAGIIDALGALGNAAGGTTSAVNSLAQGDPASAASGMVGTAVDTVLSGLGSVSSTLGNLSGIGGLIVDMTTLVNDTKAFQNGNSSVSRAKLTSDLIHVLEDSILFLLNFYPPAKIPLIIYSFLRPAIDSTIDNNVAKALADVHLTTFSGQLYNFQATGEFTLAQSTQAGNNFDIQIRLQPWAQSNSVSVMTEIGAAVGTDRVTFALNRTATVWVDGAASTVSATNPVVQLNGGTLIQLSPTQWVILWNTGEIAEFSNSGTYLNVSVGLSATDGPNSMQGLLGPNNGAANDFSLPNGTVLTEPVPSTTLYTTFANAWRITQANSLLDYGPGQTTASFTDPNFPSDTINLANLPASLIQQAQSLVAAAGITNPTEAAAAELDYLATGQTSFITSDAANGNSTSITAAPVTTTASSTPTAGVFTEQTSITESANGATAVPFTVYLTETTATSLVLDWSVVAPDQAHFGAAAFGGTLPSGQVTIAAGQLLGQFVVDLPPGALGSLASEPLEVVITPTDSTPIFAPTAQTTITNSAPEPGPAPIPTLIDGSSIGALSNSNGTYALDLGTVFKGESIAPVLLDVVNAASPGADSLSGSFAIPTSTGFDIVSNGSLPIIAPGATGTSLITLTALTGTLGSETETLILFPTDSNASGYEANLPQINVTVTDTVVNAATAAISNPATINLGTIHVGGTLDQLLTIANTATGPAGGLDVGLANLTGAAILNGAITTLAAGATNNSAITLGLSTGTAAIESGTINLALASDSGSNTLALPSQSIVLTGTVLNYASAAFAEIVGPGSLTVTGTDTTLNLGIVALGQNVTLDLGATNNSVGPSDLLSGSYIIAPNTEFTTQGFGSFSALGAGTTSGGNFVTFAADALGTATETITLTPTDYETSGFSTLLAAQTLILEAVVSTASTNPVSLTAPALVTDNPGTVIALPGITLADSVDQQITVTVTDQYGVLAATPVANGIVQGGGTNTLIISGSIAAVDTMLSSLIYRAPIGGEASDTISLTAAALGGTATSTIDVAINQPPSFALPNAALLQPGITTVLTGVTLEKADLLTSEIFTITASDQTTTLTGVAEGHGTLIGSGGTLVTLIGALSDINAELANLSLTGSTNDILTLTAADGLGGSVIANLAIDANLPGTINGLSAFITPIGTATPLPALSITDPYAAAADTTVTLAITDQFGTLTSNLITGATIQGSGSTILTLTGTVQQINNALTGLSYTPPATGITLDPLTLTLTDASGHTTTATIDALAALPPPITAPTTIAVGSAIETPIDGLTIATGLDQSVATPISVTLADTTGLLGITEANGVTYAGNGSTTLTLSGAASAVNAALGSLVYLGQGNNSTLGYGDQITLTADQAGATSQSTIAVDYAAIDPAAITDLALAGNDSAISWDQGGIGYVGTITMISYPSSQFPDAPPGSAIELYAANANSLSAQQGGLLNVTITNPSLATTLGEITGLAPQALAQELATIIGPTNIIGGVLPNGDFISNGLPFGTITLNIQNQSNQSALVPDQRIVIVGGQAIPASVQGPPPAPVVIPPPITPAGPSGGGNGDVHLTTFDGLHYDFQAAGEFLLAKSTAPGDSYQIQIRLQPWFNSATVSVMTEIAAGVGNNRVTFDNTRTSTVWVNGAPVSLTTGSPYQLGDGTLTQLSASSWEIQWNTGETLTVTNAGSFLNLSTSLGPNAQPGTVEGLLGNDNGNPQNDLALPNGTILQQPVSFASLYTNFANAWRVSQQNSLLDYGAGQTTASFTNLNFPSDNVNLANIPPNIYQNALALVTAAGITNPAFQQGAIEDYLLTGNTSFITSVAQAGQNQDSSLLLPNPTNPTAITGLGIAATTPSVTAAASGTTAVTFDIYSTAPTTSAVTIDYAVIDLNTSTGASYVAANNFTGDTLPSGVITLAAGATLTTLTLDVLGSPGSLAAQTLDVSIATAGSLANTAVVVGATGQIAIDSATPVPGIAAVAQFIDPSALGSLSGSGTNQTLSLGTVAQGSNAPDVIIDVVNAGTTGADTLSGLLFMNGNSAISVPGGLGPVVGLTAGAVDPLALSFATGSLGSFQTVLTLAAAETNQSGYQASLGDQFLTISGVVAAGPAITAPAQEILPPTIPATLTGISVSAPDNSATGLLSVTLADSTGALAITNPGFVNVTGQNSTELTLSGSGTAIDAALQSLEFSGTSSDVLTIAASLVGSVSGGALAQDTVAIIRDQAPSLSAPATLYALSGDPRPIPGLALTDPDAASLNKIFTITLQDQQGILSAQAALGGTVSANAGTAITLSGNLAAINAELATIYDNQPTRFTTDTITLTATDGQGGDASTLITIAPPPTTDVALQPATTQLTLGASGTASTTFTIATGAPLTATETFTWQAQSLSSADLLAVDFAGATLPSGSVVIDAGASLGTFAVDVTSLGTAVSGVLDVALTSVSGASTIAVPDALTTIVNIIPEPGLPAIAGFLDSSTLGVLSQSGPVETLSLGTLTLGATLTPITLGIGNIAPSGSDTLSGSIAVTGDSQITLTGLPTSFSNLAPGADPSFTVDINTSAPGAFSKIITVSPTETNLSGYQSTLAPITLDIVADIACFAEGTCLLTTRGEVAVEQLRTGDHLVLHRGGRAPIRWIGRRTLKLRQHPRPETVRPIRITAGAIADGLPSHDLLLSPDHAIYLRGILIPAKTLLNGTTIRQEAPRSITYFHIELDQHCAIYAHALPTESYLDTGNRSAFENGGSAIILHPDFAQTLREQASFAPLHESGPIVEQIRAQILARTHQPLTNDPALTLQPNPDGSVTISSRSAIPGYFSPDPRDQRTLGVKILSLRAGRREIPLDHPLLTAGWHTPEPDGRWTNGSGMIPAALAKHGPITLKLAATLAYPIHPPPANTMLANS